jgi:hypothetical protein
MLITTWEDLVRLFASSLFTFTTTIYNVQLSRRGARNGQEWYQLGKAWQVTPDKL